MEWKAKREEERERKICKKSFPRGSCRHRRHPPAIYGEPLPLPTGITNTLGNSAQIRLEVLVGG
jgi:hypothetical protein